MMIINHYNNPTQIKAYSLIMVTLARRATRELGGERHDRKNWKKLPIIKSKGWEPKWKNKWLKLIEFKRKSIRPKLKSKIKKKISKNPKVTKKRKKKLKILNMTTPGR